MSKYNFCAGPAMLPQAVMQKAQKEFLDWQDLGVSVMEISHRSKDFLALTAKCEASLRRLMNISDEFEVLFMVKQRFTARTAFGLKVPLTKLINLLKPTQSTLEMTQTGCFL